MALDLGLTTHQLLSVMDGVVDDALARGQRLDDAIDRALSVPADDAVFRTAAVGRRPYISARTGPEGLLGSISPPEVPRDWNAVAVDGSHIDVDRHLPLRCFLINLGGCAITYGRDFGCHLFSEPALAVEDDDLYLRSSGRRIRRDAHRRPTARRPAHGAGGGAPRRRRRKPAL